MQSDHQVYVGVDAGGSKSDVAVRSLDGEVDIQLRGPGANPGRIGSEEAAQRISHLIRTAIERCTPVASITICVGVAGASQFDDETDLGQQVRGALEPWQVKSVRVVPDAALVLETAFGRESGVAVVAGTGSVVWGRTPSGQTEQVGGWGYILGDDGSGYAIGRDGLRAVVRALDGGPSTRLRVRVVDHYGIQSRDALIEHVLEKHQTLHQVAPLVLTASATGDDVARQIVEEQTDQLAQQVEWLKTKIEDVRPRIALHGGLLTDEHYAETLKDALRSRYPDWSLTTTKQSPVSGALRQARRALPPDDEGPP